MNRVTRRRFIRTGLATVTGISLLPGCHLTTTAGNSSKMIFPGKEWDQAKPQTVGMNGAALIAARKWVLATAGDAPHATVIIRYGRLVEEWYQGTTADTQQQMASTCKSVYCSMLGIAVGEGRIRSLDDRLVDYYPEMMKCTGDGGANTKQYVTEKDRAVTFRQIAAQISGYMEPNEPPGRVFHYQTFGMATLMHAISKQYGYYDPLAPKAKAGDGQLIAEKLRDPIGATWSWKYTNFKHPPTAQIPIFANYTQLLMTARDMARLGHLWLNWGQWNGRSVIPEAYHRAAVRVPQITRDHIPPEDWKYGYGLWVNEFGRLWPNLPRDSYTAAGFGSRLIWVCPSLGLVVAQNPGLPEKNFDDVVRQSRLLEQIVAACKS